MESFSPNKQPGQTESPENKIKNLEKELESRQIELQKLYDKNVGIKSMVQSPEEKALRFEIKRLDDLLQMLKAGDTEFIKKPKTDTP